MDAILGVVRAILAAGAGALVSKGWVDADTANQITGALVVIGTAVWSVVSKRKAA